MNLDWDSVWSIYLHRILRYFTLLLNMPIAFSPLNWLDAQPIITDTFLMVPMGVQHWSKLRFCSWNLTKLNNIKIYFWLLFWSGCLQVLEFAFHFQKKKMRSSSIFFLMRLASIGKKLRSCSILKRKIMSSYVFKKYY